MDRFSLAKNRPGVYFNDGELTSCFQVMKDRTMQPAYKALIKKHSERFFKELGALTKKLNGEARP